MQQQQHLVQTQNNMNMMSSSAYYPNNVTTDHIQQYLDENKSLILKIVENQNSGKLNECPDNQARLQRKLMYLAAIADSQPQQSVHSQYAGSGIIHPGSNYLHQHQHSQQQMTTQSIMVARSLYGQHAYPSPQQQNLHGQLSMSTGGSNNGGLMHQSEPHGSSSLGFPDYVRSSGGREGMQASGSKRNIGSVSAEEGN